MHYGYHVRLHLAAIVALAMLAPPVSASKGPEVLKFVSHLHRIPIRGVVTVVDGFNFDLDLDPNYRHLLLPPPSRQTLHMEAYPTLRDEHGRLLGGTSDNPEWPHGTPQVLDEGEWRDLRPGDHVHVEAEWVTDNAAHRAEVADEPDLTFRAGLLKIAYVKTEGHPYFKSTLHLIPALKPGDTAVETLGTSAPLYTQWYPETWVANIVGGYAGHVVQESIQPWREARWLIEAPPLPPGATTRTHQLRWEEQVLLRPSPIDLLHKRIDFAPNGISVWVILDGSDILHPSQFVATYRVYWVPNPPPPRVMTVRLEPMPRLGVATELVVRTLDAVTGLPVAGSVEISPPPLPAAPRSYPTNVPFTITLRGRVLRANPDAGDGAFVYPSLTVSADGYSGVSLQYDPDTGRWESSR